MLPSFNSRKKGIFKPMHFMSDEGNKTYQILRADVRNAPAIPDIQKSAYLVEAEGYNDYNISPLRQTLEKRID